MKRAVSLIVLEVERVTGLREHLEHTKVAQRRGPVERGVTYPVRGGDRHAIGKAGLHEEAAEGDVPLGSGDVERGLPRGRERGQAAARSNKGAHGVLLTASGRHVQGRPALVIRPVHIHAALLGKIGDRGPIVRRGGMVDQRALIIIHTPDPLDTAALQHRPFQLGEGFLRPKHKHLFGAIFFKKLNDALMISSSGPGRTVSAEGVLSRYEGEHLIRKLCPFSLSSYQSPAWRAQHHSLERLNFEAHHHVATKREEWVKVQLLEEGKAEVLVEELLAAEVWKARVLPIPPVTEALSSQQSHLSLHTCLFHELTVANLLEAVMDSKDFVMALAGSDALFELVDYCHRKMTILVARPDLFRAATSAAGDATAAGAAAASSAATSAATSGLGAQLDEIEFKLCMISLSLFRFIADHIGSLPLNVVTRILSTNDMVGALVPLIERQPWLTRQKGGKAWKWLEGRWSPVAPQDLRRLCQPEAQVWLSLYYLLCDPEARRNYGFDTHRRDTVARLRGFFHESLLDQVPLLEHLQRAVEEIQILANAPEAALRSGLVIEQVPVLRERLLAEDPQTAADALVANLAALSSEDLFAEMKRFSELYSLDAIDDVLEAPICAACGKGAIKRCSRCRDEWYCSRECQVARWSKHKQICDIVSKEKQEREGAEKRQ
jgi:hypothetical protein